MVQVLNQLGVVVGPAMGGLLLAGAGADFVYWFDAATFLAAIAGAWAISPQPKSEGATRPGLRSIAEGFRFIRHRQGIQGAYLIDINAMVFGMPRALFPAMAVTVFHGGATTVGFLYAAPGAGALVGALTTGWVTRIRRQGLARHRGRDRLGRRHRGVRPDQRLVARTAVPGHRGLGRRHLGRAAQHDHPAVRARPPCAAAWPRSRSASSRAGPRLGDLRSRGRRQRVRQRQFSVVSGGLACIAGAALLAWRMPGFRKVEVSATTAHEAEAEAAAAYSP